MNPVIWFEIPVKDITRAKSFYEKVFDIQLSVQDFGKLQMAWFPSAQGGPGAAGSLVKAETYTPSYDGSMVYFSVENIDEVLKKANEHGGKIVNPKTAIGEFGFVGHFEDCEGNRVALHSAT